jgi:hypothetical protein
MRVDESRQDVVDLPVALLLPHQHPFFERRAVAQGKPCHKVPVVEVDGLCESFQTETAAVQAGMRVGSAGVQQSAHSQDVDPADAVVVEPDDLPGDGQERGLYGAIADRAAQVGQCLAQVLSSYTLRTVRPEQARQCFSSMRSAGLGPKVGQ